jgi:hypothetical protein
MNSEFIQQDPAFKQIADLLPAGGAGDEGGGGQAERHGA